MKSKNQMKKNIIINNKIENNFNKNNNNNFIEKKEISKWNLENKSPYKTPISKVSYNNNEIKLGEYFTLKPKFLNFKN